MPITRATNLAGLGTVFDALTGGGGLSISGVSTFTDLNVTRANVTGITTVAAGSVSAPSITPTGDSNTGIFFPSADTIAFGEGGAEALRIDSSGNIGIGTTIISNTRLVVCANPGSDNGLEIKSTQPYLNFAHFGQTGGDNFFIGHRGTSSDSQLSIVYGSGPANNNGIILNKEAVVIIGSATSTGTANQKLQIPSGGAYFSDHVSVGTTAKYQSLSVNGSVWLPSNSQITWNQGDSDIRGLDSAAGYGTSIRAYNATMNKAIPMIVTNGANKGVGINTTYTSSSYGLWVQNENGTSGGGGGQVDGAAIFCAGNLRGSSERAQIVGLFGANATTSGATANWNHSANARSGNGFYLLLGTDTNGMGGGIYYHIMNYEYVYKDSSGNMTQIAIPYTGAGTQYIRNRYSGTWSSWVAV